jgi:hypothetical protein
LGLPTALSGGPTIRGIAPGQGFRSLPDANELSANHQELCRIEGRHEKRQAPGGREMRPDAHDQAGLKWRQ